MADRLVFAKATFDHPEDGSTVLPGTPLIVDESLGEALTHSRLAEGPRAEYSKVDEGPKTTTDDPTYIYHKGGGSYLVVDEAGIVLNDDPIKGRDAAVAFANEYPDNVKEDEE